MGVGSMFHLAPLPHSAVNPVIPAVLVHLHFGGPDPVVDLSLNSTVVAAVVVVVASVVAVVVVVAGVAAAVEIAIFGLVVVVVVVVAI